MGVAAIVVRDLQAREAVEKTETKNIATDKRRPSAKGGFGSVRCFPFRRELHGGGCRVALDLVGGIGGIGDRIVLERGIKAREAALDDHALVDMIVGEAAAPSPKQTKHAITAPISVTDNLAAKTRAAQNFV